MAVLIAGSGQFAIARRMSHSQGSFAAGVSANTPAAALAALGRRTPWAPRLAASARTAWSGAQRGMSRAHGPRKHPESTAQKEEQRESRVYPVRHVTTSVREPYGEHPPTPPKVQDDTRSVAADGFKEGTFGDWALRFQSSLPFSAEEYQTVHSRLERFRLDAMTPWQMPFEYGQAAKAMAEFAPRAFARFRGHSLALDYWIASQIYNVDSKAMSTLARAHASSRGPIEQVQDALLETWHALAKPLQRLHAEEAVWVTRQHLGEHPETAELISEQTWNAMRAAIEATNWDTVEGDKAMVITDWLRGEVEADQMGRRVNAEDWARILKSVVGNLDL